MIKVIANSEWEIRRVEGRKLWVRVAMDTYKKPWIHKKYDLTLEKEKLAMIENVVDLFKVEKIEIK